MNQEREGRRGARSPVRTILRESLYVFGWGIPFGLIGGLITGNYAVSLGISHTISITLYVAYSLHMRFLEPPLERLPRDRRLVLEIVFASIETILGALLAFFVAGRIFGFAVEGPSLWIPVSMVFVTFLIVRSAEYAAIFYRDLKEKERAEEQLRTLAAQAELRALRAQINPHFLFNTLNTIAALTHTDPARAEEMIERLAEIFRYVLDGSERGPVPLEEELAFLDGYLEIEGTRFGQRLRVTREVPSELLAVPVPGLILQPLVENAIQHGRAADGSVDLTIRAHSEDNQVVITVADQGPGMPAGSRMIEDAVGHGLRNVDERLRKTYGEECGLEIAANEPWGAVVTVRVPAAPSSFHAVVTPPPDASIQ